MLLLLIRHVAGAWPRLLDHAAWRAVVSQRHRERLLDRVRAKRTTKKFVEHYNRFRHLRFWLLTFLSYFILWWREQASTSATPFARGYVFRITRRGHGFGRKLENQARKYKG
jgi:hypothetical protein